MESIQQDENPYIDLYEGKKAVEVVLAIYKSSKIGKPVKLPLKSGSSIEFQQNFNK